MFFKPFVLPEPPRFPAREVSITDFGAKENAPCTEAIANAIEDIHAHGGGRVIIPEGEWHTGAIHLKSGVELHAKKGATLRFSQKLADYLPAVLTNYEGIRCGEVELGIAIDGIPNAQMQNLYFKDISMNAKTCLTADTVDGLFMENVNLRQLP